MPKYKVDSIVRETISCSVRPSMMGPKDVKDFMWPYVVKYEPEHREMFWAIAVNTKNRVISLYIISIGSLNASIVHPREIFRPAILDGAASIVIVHNHPTGDAEPSKEDVEFTQRFKKCGELIGIQLLDHLIIGDVTGRFFSFKESGRLS